MESFWELNGASHIMLIATVVNALAIVVLVGITWWYAKSTAKLLQQSRRASEAAERQAAASEESIRVLRQQIEEQAGLGKAVVQGAIESAQRIIEHWNAQDLQNLTFSRRIPQTLELVPTDANTVIEHAMRISRDGAIYLSAGFDNLGFARNVLETLRDSPDQLQTFRQVRPQFNADLDNATQELDRARELLQI